jgi:hypothetical protein
MAALQVLVALSTLTLMVWGLLLLDEIEHAEISELTAPKTSRSDI